MTCEHEWWRDFMLVSTYQNDKQPDGAGAEHLCIKCGLREWEPLTERAHRKRLLQQRRDFK